MTRFEIRWQLPLAEGRALCHAASMLAGTRMVWADPAARPDHHATRARLTRLRGIIAAI